MYLQPNSKYIIFINKIIQVIACACILVACKCESHQGKLIELCNAYLNFNNKIFGVFSTVIKPEVFLSLNQNLLV